MRFPKFLNYFFKDLPNLPPFVATEMSSVCVVTNCSERCNENLGLKRHILYCISIHMEAFKAPTLQHWLEPYYIHKLAQMWVSLETSIYQNGRKGSAEVADLRFLIDVLITVTSTNHIWFQLNKLTPETPNWHVWNKKIDFIHYLASAVYILHFITQLLCIWPQNPLQQGVGG